MKISGLLGLAIGTLLASQPSTTKADSADAALDRFFRTHLDARFELRPMEATWLGDHRFGNRLDDLSPEARTRWRQLLRATLRDLPRLVDYRRLTRDGQIDFEILRHELQTQLWLAEYTRPWEDDPRIYNRYLSDSTYLLLAQSTLPLDTRLDQVLARMAQMPRIVASARANLKRPPRTHTETAIRQNRGTLAYYQDTLLTLAGDTPRVAELRAAAVPVLAALHEHQRFLEDELLPRADGDWRLGRRKFARKLELTLNAGLTADEVLAEAEAEFTRVEDELFVIARQVWGRHFPRQPIPPDDPEGRRETVARVLAEVSRDHGTPDSLVDDVRSQVAALRTFIAEHDILRLPEPDRCEIIEMPEFQRGNSTAYMNSPPPLDPLATGYYAVSPPPRDWDADRVRSYLEEYNRHMLQILSIHEAYPGHYVQLEYANRHPSLVRKVFGSGVYIEGWAVYTERTMLDQGYGDGDPSLRLMQLKFYLRAVANAILDHRMHCTGMTEDEAMDLLARRSYQSEGEARLKVVRARQSSVQLSTYFVGRMAFQRLRRAIQREQGDAFDLGRFHEAALAPGSVPVKYLPELVRRHLTEPR
ncbi:MAG: DUF885 domain-containing protein [Verrucomicrobiae bacterium]|nr:DUF885 domain-containing protein [Verrucomicrobiae bacterium]